MSTPTAINAVAQASSVSSTMEDPQPTTPSEHQSNTGFPFLALPAELRNRIYRMALGGLTIGYSRYPQFSRTVTACCTVERYERWLSPAFDKMIVREMARINESDLKNEEDRLRRLDAEYHDRVFNSRYKEPSSRHPGNGNKANGLLPLDLLLACRQIYHEAALVPFRENTFRFEINRGGSLQGFLSRLQKFQIAAIRSLVIFTGPNIYVSGFLGVSLAGLQSVRSLVLGYSLATREIYGLYGRPLPEERFNPVPIGLHDLAVLPLQEVTVTVDRFAYQQKNRTGLPGYTPYVPDAAEEAKHFLLTKCLPARLSVED